MTSNQIKIYRHDVGYALAAANDNPAAGIAANASLKHDINRMVVAIRSLQRILSGQFEKSSPPERRVVFEARCELRDAIVALRKQGYWDKHRADFRSSLSLIWDADRYLQDQLTCA